MLPHLGIIRDDVHSQDILSFPLTGCAQRRVGAYALEENTDYRPDLYSYVVRTPSADWYIAQADLDLMGEEAFYAGLEEILELQEADFAEVREALAPCITGEVPKVMILTDFSGQAEASTHFAAYYNPLNNFVKVFHSWEQVKASLVHEYVHYLTFTCTGTQITAGFWAEGAAEYFSRFVCQNQLARSVNLGLPEAEVDFFRSMGAWNSEAACLDMPMVYLGTAEVYLQGYMVGQSYYSVSDGIIERTERIQEDPHTYQLSMQEAAAMFVWLTETYGLDLVSAHWNCKEEDMERVFGLPFPELYDAWGEWNVAQCEALGIDVSIQPPVE